MDGLTEAEHAQARTMLLHFLWGQPNPSRIFTARSPADRRCLGKAERKGIAHVIRGALERCFSHRLSPSRFPFLRARTMTAPLKSQIEHSSPSLAGCRVLRLFGYAKVL